MTVIDLFYMLGGMFYGAVMVIFIYALNHRKPKYVKYYPYYPKPKSKPVSFDEYSDWVVYRWMHQPNKILDLRDHYIMTVGVGEEAGEVQGLLKKWVRDGNLSRTKLVKECGDVLYYLTRIMRAHNIMPSEALQENMIKVEGRLVRGTLHGSGDDR